MFGSEMCLNTEAVVHRPLACNKIETLTQVFPCEFCKTLRTPFLTEHFRWLLLSTPVQICTGKFKWLLLILTLPESELLHK